MIRLGYGSTSLWSEEAMLIVLADALVENPNSSGQQAKHIKRYFHNTSTSWFRPTMVRLPRSTKMPPLYGADSVSAFPSGMPWHGRRRFDWLWGGCPASSGKPIEADVVWPETLLEGCTSVASSQMQDAVSLPGVDLGPCAYETSRKLSFSAKPPLKQTHTIN